jgi:hypothetical protein
VLKNVRKLLPGTAAGGTSSTNDVDHGRCRPSWPRSRLFEPTKSLVQSHMMQKRPASNDIPIDRLTSSESSSDSNSRRCVMILPNCAFPAFLYNSTTMPVPFTVSFSPEFVSGATDRRKTIYGRHNFRRRSNKQAFYPAQDSNVCSKKIK